MKSLLSALVALTSLSACGPVVVDGYRPYGSNVPASTSTPSGVTWSTDAREFRGMNGVKVLFTCPAGGTTGVVYGSDLYTDDSSVCTAGVHSGRIRFSDGGPVVIEIRAGAASYAEGVRNGVSTNGYAAYDGSFIVL